MDQKFSISALSYESPTEPIDAVIPLSDKRSENCGSADDVSLDIRSHIDVALYTAPAAR